MKTERMFAFGDGVYFAAVNDFGNAVAFIAYGKDEARRVLQEHPNDQPEVTEKLLADLDIAAADGIPNTATQPTRRVAGRFVNSLMNIVFANKTGETGATTVEVLDDLRSSLVFVLMPGEKRFPDAVIGYVDAEGAHHVTALFSREQLSEELASWSWATDEVREVVTTVAHRDIVTLPDYCSKKPVRLDGKLAMVFNSSYTQTVARQLMAQTDEADAQPDNGPMRLYFTMMYRTGGMLAFSQRKDGATHLTVFVVYGKDEARRTLLTHCYEDERIESILQALETETMLDVAGTGTERHDGDFVDYLCNVAASMKNPENAGLLEEGTDDILYEGDGLSYLWLPNGDDAEEVDYGVFHYERDGHHLAVVFSRRQAREELAAIKVSDKERTNAAREIAESRLPEEDERTPVRIAGHLAGILNTAVVRTAEAEEHDELEHASSSHGLN